MPEYREHRTKARLMIYANGSIDLWPGYDNTVACFDSESAKWIRDMLVMNHGQPEPEPARRPVQGRFESRRGRIMIQQYSCDSFNLYVENGNVDVEPADFAWLRETLAKISGDSEPEPAKTQVGGDHYAKHAIQPWDAIREWYGDEGFEAYLAGNVIRYLARYKDKNGVEDIRKAAHYCERLIQHLEGRDK